MNEIQEESSRRKRILWQAKHRGTLELDIMIGGFAESQLDKMSVRELDAFERVLALPEQDLQNWLLGLGSIPVSQCDSMLTAMISFVATDRR